VRRGVAYAWVLALVLANFGHLAWRVWIAPPAAGTVPWRAPGAPARVAAPLAGIGTIQLAGEARADEGNDAGALPSGTVTVCWQAGPFVDPGATTAALADLRGRGFAPQVAYAPGIAPLRWLVRIEGLPTQPDQVRVLARLRAAGIGDLAALPRESLGYAISVGVFSEAPRAARRLEQVRAAGIEAQIVPRYASDAERWLQVTFDPAAMPAGIAPGTAPAAALAGAWRVQPCEALP
jgi:hypothetical protein